MARFDRTRTTAVELVPRASQQVAVEQWFNGNGFNSAQASVIVDFLLDTQVTLEVLRLDGIVLASWPVTLNATDGWTTIGGQGWVFQEEDVLEYRITSQGPGAVRVDTTFVSLAL